MHNTILPTVVPPAAPLPISSLKLGRWGSRVKLWGEKFGPNKLLSKHTFEKYTNMYTFQNYTFWKYTFWKYTFWKYTFGKYTLVRPCLLVTLIKCLKGRKCRGSFLKAVQLQLAWESESVTHKQTNSQGWVIEMLPQLKRMNIRYILQSSINCINVLIDNLGSQRLLLIPLSHVSLTPEI